MANLMPAFGYVANNATKMSNVLWVVNNDNTQTIATGANNWGYWTLCGPCVYDVLTGTSSQNPTVYSSTGTGSNSSNTNSVMTLLGSAFTRTTGSRPILAWQETGLVYGDFGIGSGTESDPFRIQSQSDLEAINEALNGNNGFAGKYFKIMNDLTLDSTWQGLGSMVIAYAQTNSPYPAAGSVGFAGIIDGNGSTITVSRTVTDISAQGGFINYLTPTGQVNNLTVSGTMDIIYTAKPDCDSTVDGISAFGGVVGYNCGIIDGVTNKVVITNGDNNSDEKDDDTTEIYCVGGIAGFNDAFYLQGACGTIRNCTNNASITGYEKVGGITGENAGLIASCLNSINTTITPTSTRRSGAGGIAGRNGNNNTAEEVGIIRGCANYGNIYSGKSGTSQEAQDTQSSWIGGIAGWLSDTCWIYNSYNYGNVRGYGYAGYIAGGTGWTTTTGATNYTGGIKYCYTRTDSTGATSNVGGRQGVNGTQLAAGSYGYLNLENETYGTFSLDTYYKTPMPNFDATASAGSSEGWAHIEKSVYLDTSASDNGTGTLESPYNNLKDAVEGAGIGKVYVMSSVTITSRTTLYNSTEFIRYTANGFSGPMFIINAPDSEFNNEVGTTYITLESGIVDGSGVGILFQVNQGRLRLRGGVQLRNAQEGVYVNATGDDNAEVQLDETYIDTARSVYIADNDSIDAQKNGFIYSESGKYAVKLQTVAYMGSNVYIQCSSKVTCPLYYECGSAQVGQKTIQGVSPYKGATFVRELKDTDIANVMYPGNAASLALSGATAGNYATISNMYIGYVNGTLTSNGTGTEASPYNNLSDALNDDNIRLVLIMGTVALPSGTYSGTKAVQIGTTGTVTTMFTYNNIDADATFSGLRIIGTAPGAATSQVGTTTVLSISAGSVTLDGNTRIESCGTAVDQYDGSCTVKSVRVNALQYSFKVEDYIAYLYFNTTSNTQINGKVYLESSIIQDAQFYISSALNPNIVVECASPYSGYIVASSTPNSGYSITSYDAQKVSYMNANYKVELQGGNLVLAS
jgi:hypothetical protein